MAVRAGAVPAAVAGERRHRRSATRAITRPMSAPKSSSSTTGSSGCFERRMKRNHDASPLNGRGSFIAVRNEKLSSAMATSRMPMAQPGDSSSWGCEQLLDALVDREHASRA